MTEAQATSRTRLAAAAPAIGFAAGGIVLLGVAQLPIGYYSFARWAVCAAAVSAFILAVRANAGLWGLLLLPMAMLWNPLVPVYMSRSEWLPLDLIAGVGLLGFGFWALRRRSTEIP